MNIIYRNVYNRPEKGDFTGVAHAKTAGAVRRKFIACATICKHVGVAMMCGNVHIVFIPNKDIK